MRKAFALTACLYSGAFAAQATIDDFAYQAQIADHDEPLQRIALPARILLDLTRADLGDLAVFNAAGKPLPHAVVRAPRRVSDHRQALPLYEFSQFRQQQSKTVTTRRQSQQGGTLEELRTIEKVPVQTRRRDYLIELAPAPDTPHFERIELEWTHQPADQWLELRVEAGNDVDHLRVIKQRKRLTNRDRSNPTWYSIAGLPRGQKYLRLVPADSVVEFELLRAEGYYQQTQPPQPVAQRIEIERSDDPSGWTFALPSRVRAESLRIVPVDSHSVINGDLYAIWGELDDRRVILRGFRQHNIVDPGVKPNTAISLPRHALERIWIAPHPPPDTPPRVELLYPRYEVVFLGDGVTPYRLAWGNHSAAAENGELSGLLADDLQAAQQRGVLLELGPVELAGGPERLRPKPVLPWQKWLLWTLLIASAAITGRMALGLYREMNRDSAGAGRHSD